MWRPNRHYHQCQRFASFCVKRLGLYCSRLFRQIFLVIDIFDSRFALSTQVTWYFHVSQLSQSNLSACEQMFLFCARKLCKLRKPQHCEVGRLRGLCDLGKLYESCVGREDCVNCVDCRSHVPYMVCVVFVACVAYIPVVVYVASLAPYGLRGLPGSHSLRSSLSHIVFVASGTYVVYVHKIDTPPCSMAISAFLEFKQLLRHCRIVAHVHIRSQSYCRCSAPTTLYIACTAAKLFRQLRCLWGTCIDLLQTYRGSNYWCAVGSIPVLFGIISPVTLGYPIT